MNIQDLKAEIEREKQGIYRGNYNLKYEDIFWITQEGERVYSEQGLQWTLRNTMEFIMEFEDILYVAEWEDMLTCYELFTTGQYYNRSEGKVIYPTDEEYEELSNRIDRLRIADFHIDISMEDLPF